MDTRTEPDRPAVLIVDDEPVIRDILSRLLEQEGLRVFQADGPAGAAEVYARHRAAVRLVLVDLCLRGGTGRQALLALRAVDPGVRCCLLTGAVLEEAEEAAHLRAGFVAVLYKPFRPSDVVDLLRRLAPAPVEDTAPPRPCHAAPESTPSP